MARGPMQLHRLKAGPSGSDVVETVTSGTETETWLKFRDETETLP